MKKLLAGSLSVVALLMAACSGGSAAGTYELDKSAMKDAILAAMPADAKANKETAAMAESMAGNMHSTVELKAGGEATMNIKMELPGGMKIDESAGGTWKLAGNKLTLTLKDNKGGKEESKTAEYANGSFTIEETEGPMKMKMTFRRK